MMRRYHDQYQKSREQRDRAARSEQPEKKNSRRGETLKAVLLPCPYVSFDGSVLRSAHGLEHDFFIEQA